jgi:MinD-like ATPase involved in chromosome partitioning or flagellar assembly
MDGDSPTHEPPAGLVTGDYPRASILLLLGGTQRHITVPADVPLEQLVDALVDKYALGEDPGAWTLVSSGDRVELDLRETLQSAGIEDLQELALVRRNARREPSPAVAVSPGADGRSTIGGDGVAERTSAMLPSRPALGARIGAVWSALVSSGPRAPLAGPEDHVDPASLAVEPRRGALRRCLHAHRQSSYRHQLEAQVRTAEVVRPIVIAVNSGKGGVGKTTLAALLATLLAFLRPERVIAVDANPDFGMLGALLAPGLGVPIDQLTGPGGPLASPSLTGTELDRLLARGPDGLLICPGPIDPDRSRALTSEHYLTAFAALRRHAAIIVVDCGTSFTTPAAQAVLEVADQLLLLSDDTMQAAAVAIYAARWLRAQGHELTLTINQRRRRGYIDLRRLQVEIPDARGLASTPTDHAAVAQLAGSRLSWREDQGRLGIAMREVAALLAYDWQRLTSWERA